MWHKPSIYVHSISVLCQITKFNNFPKTSKVFLNLEKINRLIISKCM